LATGAVALQFNDFEMKLTRKILKFAEPLTYRRGWRRAQRSIFRLPLGPMLAQIDWERAREIQQRYANSTTGYAKYADIEPWLRLNRERVQDLNLHRSATKRVLDLGCGGGFFLFILKNLGHSVMGLDIDRVPLFGELLELFGVRRVVYKIDAFEPLPDLGQQFDWITAFSTNFYLYHPAKKRWGPAEWDFFCAIYSITWRRAEKSFLDSIPPTTAAITRLKYAIFFSVVAQTSSGSESFSSTACASDGIPLWCFAVSADLGESSARTLR
jgi:SAM-dependent methyltransferase